MKKEMPEVLTENPWSLAKPKLWITGRYSFGKTFYRARKSSDYSQVSLRVKKEMLEVPTENPWPLAKPKLWLSGRYNFV